MSELKEPERTILHILASHAGPAHAITRGDLLNMVNAELGTGYRSDRAIRDAIENLRSTRKEGAHICALFPSDTEPGYFLARNEAEARAYMKSDYSRYLKLGNRLEAQERLLNESQNTVPAAQIGMPL